jgi:hypothetical protein
MPTNDSDMCFEDPSILWIDVGIRLFGCALTAMDPGVGLQCDSVQLLDFPRNVQQPVVWMFRDDAGYSWMIYLLDECGQTQQRRCWHYAGRRSQVCLRQCDALSASWLCYPSFRCDEGPQSSWCASTTRWPFLTSVHFPLIWMAFSAIRATEAMMRPTVSNL